MTNYEKIKNMTVEEMADYLAASIYTECRKVCHASNKTFEKTIKNWLESEVQNE